MLSFSSRFLLDSYLILLAFSLAGPALRMEVSLFSFPSLQEVFPSCSSPLAAARVSDSVPVEVLPSVNSIGGLGVLRSLLRLD